MRNVLLRYEIRIYFVIRFRILTIQKTGLGQSILLFSITFYQINEVADAGQASYDRIKTRNF